MKWHDGRFCNGRVACFAALLFIAEVYGIYKVTLRQGVLFFPISYPRVVFVKVKVGFIEKDEERW